MPDCAMWKGFRLSDFCPPLPVAGAAGFARPGARRGPGANPSAIMSPSPRRRVDGFTLIELMIVVVVVAILATVALPSYQEHVRKSRRVDAQSAMLELAQFMERHYTIHSSYMGTALPSSVTSRVADFYTITLGTQSAQAYTLQAAPTAKQAADPCGTLTLAHTGARTPASAGCWN